MKIELTPAQREQQLAYRAFARERLLPVAERIDQEQRFPPELIRAMADAGHLGGLVPAEHGGRPADLISFGLLNEELGYACSSARSLVTVHSMVCHALLRWGSPEQQARWLPRLARGEQIGAFALTEPEVGSDAKSIRTVAAARSGGGFSLTGRKRWITFGQVADVYLLFARAEGGPAAFLVRRDTPGFSVKPISNMLGTRGAMLAELELDGCQVGQEDLIARPGFGISAVATSALDIGRYSVAWGCVGLAQACLDSSATYAAERNQFGVPLKNHQLVRRMLADMVTGTKAARLVCLQAGYLKDIGDPRTVRETFIAKYLASTTAMRIASDAVQIHGANGCSPRFPVARFFRDAKIMEIIEGSTEIQQYLIAEHALEER